MSRRGPITAGALLAELSNDPEFLAREQDEAQRIANARRMYAEAAAGLLAELHEAGFDVRNMEQLRQPGVGDRRAVPILLNWLPEITYDALRQDVIHTLSWPWARRDALRPLIAEFHRVDPATDPLGATRWSIGDTLERIATDAVAPELVEIARDTRHGPARGLVVLGLGRLKKSRELVVPVLLDLVDDPDVDTFAVMALGKLKVAQARPKIEPFTRDPDSWVRNKAKQALAKLPDD